MAVTLDSYSESNQNKADDIAQAGVGDRTQEGQSFTTPNDGISYTLDSAKFYMQNVGSMTGTVQVRVCTHSGTYGTSSVPTTTLATSGTVSIAGISSSFALVTFTFSGANRIVLSPNTHYCLLAECPTGNGDNVSIYLNVGGANPGGHGGNLFNSFDNSTFVPVATQDYCFYVYGVVPTTTNGSALMMLL